jgi:hypothetical protein
MRNILLIAVLAILPIGLSAARPTHRDGTVVTGRMISGSTAAMVFEDETGRRRVFDLDQISMIGFNMIGFNPGSGPAPVYDQDRSYTQQSNEQRNYRGSIQQDILHDNVEFVGGGVEVLTKGREIRVPVETLLTFRLS